MDGSFSSKPTRKRRSQELEASHGINHTLESKKEKTLQDARSLDLLPIGEAPKKAAGVDRLSRLPDEILGTIVSLLSTRDATLMQVVSRLWCQIWRSTSLSLDMRAFSANENKRIIIAGKILAAHRGPIHHIVLVSYCLERCITTFEDWLKLPMLNNLSQLDFQFATKNTTTDQEADMTYSLVLSLLRFSPTLQEVNLSRCCIRDDLITRPLHFPKLRKLNLHSVTASEGSLHAVISACPSLESLNINYTIGLPRLCIRSASLRSLCIGTTHGLKQEVIFQEIVVEDAPLLERLIPAFLDDGPTSIQVISAPRLQILGILPSFISRLEIGTAVIQEMPSVSMTMSVPTVKILVLQSVGPNLAAFVDLLKYFSCLEKMYIKLSLQPNVKNDLRNYHPGPVHCLEHHLKTIVLKRYQEKTSVVNFAKFFILNAKVLKVMTFGVRDIIHQNEKWMTNQRRRLQLHNKVSKEARFDFDSKYWCDYPESTKIDDFSISDPFDLSV
uniref:F-box domain-containing protein n=1 Tax=Oryza brachyantha TaxID=4533 RepID=J3MK20_ORYBR